MEYTKGEWYLELRPADNVRRVRCNSETIADVFGTNAEDKANAHLIASAPDLYEALKESLLYLQAIPNVSDAPVGGLIKRVEKALAKAEGNNICFKGLTQ